MHIDPLLIPDLHTELGCCDASAMLPVEAEGSGSGSTFSTGSVFSVGWSTSLIVWKLRAKSWMMGTSGRVLYDVDTYGLEEAAAIWLAAATTAAAAAVALVSGVMSSDVTLPASAFTLAANPSGTIIGTDDRRGSMTGGGIIFESFCCSNKLQLLAAAELEFSPEPCHSMTGRRVSQPSASRREGGEMT